MRTPVAGNGSRSPSITLPLATADNPATPAKPAATYGADAGHKEPKSVIASTRGPATEQSGPSGAGEGRVDLSTSRAQPDSVPCDPRAVTVFDESAAPGQATSGVRRLLSRPDRSRRGERHSVIPPQSPSSSPGSRPLPQVRAPCARHQTTLIAAARPQTTTSSPLGTVSQAELTVKSNSPRVRELADPCLLTPIGARTRTCEGCRRRRVVLIYPRSP